jgi:hypothetical protein
VKCTYGERRKIDQLPGRSHPRTRASRSCFIIHRAARHFCGGDAPPEPQALAHRIDARLAEKRKADDIEPAPPADDAEFPRRAYLDLISRIPAPQYVHEFPADRDPAKRRKLIEYLLERPRFVSHFVTVWTVLLQSEIAASADARLQRFVGLQSLGWILNGSQRFPKFVFVFVREIRLD